VEELQAERRGEEGGKGNNERMRCMVGYFEVLGKNAIG